MTARTESAAPDNAAVPLVLVVDDDAALVRLIRLTLREDGFEVIIAADGEAALERVAEHLPDAIVADLEMPVMDGRSFYRKLRSRGYDIPVLVLSAYGASQARRELGANAALDKPFDPDRLVRKVRALVA